MIFIFGKAKQNYNLCNTHTAQVVVFIMNYNLAGLKSDRIGKEVKMVKLLKITFAKLIKVYINSSSI